MPELYFKVGSDVDRVIQLREEIAKLKKELTGMDGNTPPATLRAMEVQLAKNTKEMDALIVTAVRAGNEMEQNFKKKIFDASQAVNGFTDKIIAQKNVVKDVEADVRRLGEAYRLAAKSKPMSVTSKLSEYNASKRALEGERAALFGLTQEQAKSRLSVKSLRDEYSLYKNDSTKVVSANEDIAGSLKHMVLAVAGADAIKDFISNVLTITGDFQKMEAVLTNTLGSASKAKDAIDMLADFGATTPFQVNELTSSFVKLANQGFTPTAEEMRKLGDLASSTGKSFDQLSEAILDAQTNEFERLKEFGIRASKNGDQVMFSFKEQQTTVKNTASAIREYILSLGDLEGVVGANEKIAATFAGQLSNIQDQLVEQFRLFGEAYESELSLGIDATAAITKNLNNIIPVITGVITAYGVYRAAVLAVNAAHKASMIAGMAKKFFVLAQSVKLATAAQQAFNVASKANIYATLISLLLGLGAAVYMFSKKTNDATDAQDRLNRLNKEAAESIAKEKSELSLLLSVAKNEKVSKEGRLDAIQKLNEISPKYLGNLNLENINTKLAADAVDQYTMSLEKNAKTKAIVAQMQEIEEGKLKNAQRLTELAEKEAGKNWFNKGVDWLNEAAYNMPVGAKGSSKPSIIANREETIAIQENNKELDKKYQLLIDINSENERGNRSGAVIPKNIQLEAEKKNLEYLKQEHAKLVEQINNKPIGVMVDPLEKLKLENYVSLIKESGDKINDLSKETSAPSVAKEIENTVKKISELKQELTDLRNGKTSVEAGKTVKDTIDAKLTELKAAEDALSTLTGKDTASDKKASDEQKKALELRKKLNEELLSLRMQNQQAEINLMAEGREKRLAQIEFDYDSEIAVILAKEKEWKEAQSGKLTGDQTKEIQTSFLHSYVKKEKSIATVDKDQLEAEKQAMNEYLVAYGNYQEKRKAITEKYNSLITKATTEGEKLSLAEEMRTALSDLDMEVSSKTSAIGQLFDDMSKRSVADMRAIADAAEQALSFITNGEWDEAKGGELGISKESFDTLRKSPKELESIKNEIANVKKEADQCETSFNKISGGLKKMFSSGGDTKKFQEGLAEVSEGMNKVMQAGQFLSDSLSELGNAFGNDTLTGIAEGVNVAMDAMGSAMDGAKAGAAFGPWGAAAGAAIGMVTSLASSFAKIHDAKNEKRIAVLQEQIETLDKSYDMLGDAIDKAYSKDASNLIDQQNKLLEQQKVLIRQQIREEEDKKKTDDDRIKEWREQLEEIDKTLADNKEKAVDAIFGEDLQSAIDNFAQAYADAWASGEDRAKSMKDVARNMIRGTIVEMIKSSAGLGETVKKIREMITGYLADGVVSDWEQGQLDAYIESETAKLDGKYDWADKYMKEDKEFDLGITSDSIADTIAEGLADGKSGFKDFAGSFEDMMRTAVINSLKTKHLEGPLKEFQKKFSELSESGGQLTEAEIEELRGMYADIIDGAKVQFDSLKDIAGLDFTADSDNSLKGAYAKASQESITLLAGQTGAARVALEDIRNNMQPIREQMQAIREMNSKGWEDVKAIRDLTMKIDKNTEQVATNTRQIKEVADKVADNTRNTVDALEGTINVKIKGM